MSKKTTYNGYPIEPNYLYDGKREVAKANYYGVEITITQIDASYYVNVNKENGDLVMNTAENLPEATRRFAYYVNYYSSKLLEENNYGI